MEGAIFELYKHHALGKTVSLPAEKIDLDQSERSY